MLTTAERIVFLILVVVCGGLAFRGFANIVRIVRRGRKAEPREGLLGRFLQAFLDVALQRPVFKTRPLVSVFHAFIFFGFSFYLLVNVNDLLEAYVSGWSMIGRGGVAGVFNLLSDLLSVLVLTGMVALLVRRFLAKPKSLEFNASVKLHPRVVAGGVPRDSLIVGVFILLHVGARWVGTALHLAKEGHGDPWLPTASLLAAGFSGLGEAALETGTHLCWWVAMGLIVLFLPYFPRSKHLHLMVAPVNLALEKRTPRGLLEAPPDAANPGAKELTDLSWPLLLDSYACIMCNRCQDACPAHATGTPLSPAALEINKRYYANEHAASLASGDNTGGAGLLDFAISEDAVWSCTSCYACVRICPVGNAPMFDLIEMRRGLVFDGAAPDEVAEVLRHLDEKGNSFGESARKRPRWAKKLDFKIPDARKQPVEYLWFVGDFASYDPQCQEISRTVARILNSAGIDFGILYETERSAGNDIRRVGEEGLFESLAEQNAAALAECEFEKIFTTDPHTFNALKNEYGPFVDGGPFDVVHYSTLLLDLFTQGRLEAGTQLKARGTYHDPCFLGRYNGGFEAPRGVIRACGLELVEMPRSRENSFCCGAGGGRIWMKDHPDVVERPSENRIREALELGAVDYFVVACPKDLTMYRDAVKSTGSEGQIAVKDIADLVAEAIGLSAAEVN
ncbi:MAG: (Fe-S)-binding protein [Acidobacteriota bacterium]|nr:(Fe-S)-binding protein [Acidobacteriota bacterium]